MGTLDNFFANIFENPLFGLRHPEFSQAVYNNGDYTTHGLLFIVFGLLALSTFYRFWDPNPVKRWKWFLTLVINSVLIFGISYYLLSTGIMEAYLIENEPIANMTPSSFTFLMALNTCIFGFIWSVLMSLPLKLFSINNRKNPI